MANESLVMTASMRDDFSSTLRKLQNELKSLSTTGAASTKNLQKDWKGVGSEIRAASGSITRDMLPAMRLGNLAGLALGGAIGGAAVALKNFAQNTMTLGNFSKEIGLASREVAKLQAMGGFFGIDPSTTQANFRTFQTFLQAMKKDGGETISHLRQVFGSAGDQLAGALLKPGTFREKMELAFQAIRNVDSEPTARKMAQELFGNEAWATAIRNMTPELQAAFARIASKIDENKDAATRFNVALLEWKITVQNLTESAFGPLLKVTTELMDKWKNPIENKFKEFAADIGVALTALQKLASGEYLEGLKQIGEILWKAHPLSKIFPFDGPRTETPGSAAITRGMNAQFGKPGASAPGSPDKDIPRTNEDLRQANQRLTAATEKQTSTFEKFLAIIGQGGDTAGLGPGLGGVSGGGGGLGSLRGAIGGIAGGMGGIGPAGRMGGGGGPGGPVDPAQLEMFKKMGGMPTPQQAEQVLSAMKPNMDPMAPAGTAPGGGPMTTVTTAGGRKFTVASAYAENFRGFLNDYEKAGGVIGPSSGGLAGRPGNASYHPLGRAIDLNQVGYGIRAKTGSTLPREVEDSLAAKWGLYPGSRFGDIGHFEVRNAQMARAALEAQGKAVGSGPVGQGSVPPPNPNAPGHLGLRNFNFGNLKYGMGSANKYEGVVGPSQGRDDGDQQIVFKSMEHGIKAAEKLALDKAGQGKNTIAKLVAEQGGWTPGNMIAARNIAKSMGVGVHDEVDMTNADTRTNFLKALGKQEQLPGKALDDALGKVEGVVKGGKVDATGTVNIHISGDHKNSNVKASTDGMFKDVNVNRGKPMGTAEDLTPLNRASAGF